MSDVVGHPLIVDDEFMALSQDDLFVRWRPRSNGEYVTIAHPAPGTPEPDLTPVTRFGGYPLVNAPGGIVIADDQVSPFISKFQTLFQPAWHRPILNRLGVPAVSRGMVFTNVGGDNALSALVALDASSGRSVWEYAPLGFAGEPLYMLHRQKQRPLTDQERFEIENAFAHLGQRVQRTSMPATMPLVQATPAINAVHGHWFNPGLVTVGESVYGQVRSDIVALGQQDGRVIWSFRLDPRETAHSLAATKDHLFVSLPKRLIALNLESGKLEWSEEVPSSGTLSIASGHVFLAMGAAGSKGGGELRVFRSKTRVAPEGVRPPIDPPSP
jgi:hypothetical protein